MRTDEIISKTTTFRSITYNLGNTMDIPEYVAPPNTGIKKAGLGYFVHKKV
jgi:hypothetical protein